MSNEFSDFAAIPQMLELLSGSIASKFYADTSSYNPTQVHRENIESYRQNNRSIDILKQWMLQSAITDQEKAYIKTTTDSSGLRWLFGTLENTSIGQQLLGGTRTNVYESTLGMFQQPIFNAAGSRVFSTSIGGARVMDITARKVNDEIEKYGLVGYHNMGAGILQKMGATGAFEGMSLVGTGQEMTLAPEFNTKITSMIKAAGSSFEAMKALFGNDKGIGTLLTMAEEITGETFKTVEGANAISNNINLITMGAIKTGMNTRSIGDFAYRLSSNLRSAGISAKDSGIAVSLGLANAAALNEYGADFNTTTAQVASVYGQAAQSSQFKAFAVAKTFIKDGRITDPGDIDRLNNAIAKGDALTVNSILSKYTRGASITGLYNNMDIDKQSLIESAAGTLAGDRPNQVALLTNNLRNSVGGLSNNAPIADLFEGETLNSLFKAIGKVKNGTPLTGPEQALVNKYFNKLDKSGAGLALNALTHHASQFANFKTISLSEADKKELDAGGLLTPGGSIISEFLNHLVPPEKTGALAPPPGDTTNVTTQNVTATTVIIHSAASTTTESNKPE